MKTNDILAVPKQNMIKLHGMDYELDKKQERVLNSSGVEKFTHRLSNGLTKGQKSDLYSEVALA